MSKIMVVTGEVSGDMHAARVIREIKKMAPATEFYGMGSDYLKEEGVHLLIDPTEVSTIGFLEAFKNLRVHLQHLKILKNSIEQENPDLIFLVDNSGFSMMMARIAFKKGIPVVNYFSPSAWVWGKWRAHWMAHYQVTIASVFPMEARVYRDAGARVVFVGHPLLDLVKVKADKDQIMAELDLDPDRPVVGLLPGSRYQEIERLLPEMIEAAVKIWGDEKKYQFVIPVARGINKKVITEIISNYNLNIKLIENKAYQIMKISELLITASGTATLEAAIIGTPMIIVYQVSPLTYRLGKGLVQLDYIGLPNIIAGWEVVPELIQEEARADNIYSCSMELLNNINKMKKTREELSYVRKKLGSPGAVRRTAELVLAEGGSY